MDEKKEENKVETRIKEKIGTHLTNVDVNEVFKAVSGGDEKINLFDFMVVAKKLYEETHTYADFVEHHTEIWKRVKKVMDKADLNGDALVDKCEFATLLYKGVVASENTWKP